jgi:hypothetical protein
MDLNESVSFILSITIFTVLTILNILYKRLHMIKELLRDKFFILNICTIILFCIYVINFSNENNKRREIEIDAIKKAILAIIIATFAYLDMIVGSFWLVYIIAYYLKGFI